MRTVMAVMALMVSASPLVAQGWIDPVRPSLNSAVTKVRTAVRVRVEGRIAVVEVEEWFRNDGARLGEGDYLYPLPGEAVFSNFSLYQGDEELRGEMMDATQARSIYEEIVRRKRDPALIELVGHGMVRARVFPIGAGETRKITLRYTQIMPRAGSALQFRYAAGGARRASGEGTDRPAGSDAPLDFRLTAPDGAAFHDPFSPTHRVTVRREEGSLVVQPDNDLRGGFSLFLPLADALIGMTVATHRPAGEAGYFMLTLSPGTIEGRMQPRDVTAVVDVSGSMSGEKLEQAKAALRGLLQSLREGDRFRLVSFSNRVSSHAGRWTAANPTTIREARIWIDNLHANGGTNIEAALREGFRLSTPDARLPIVLFLTDGLPSVGEKDPEQIAARAEAASGRSRVFAFGVGYDVNTYLLDRLTVAGRGATQYVEPTEDVEQALGMLTQKIQHPVLTDLVLGDTPVRLTEMYPRTLPDLFAGEELIVFGRYEAADEDRTGTLQVQGRRGGRVERFAAQSEFRHHTLDNDFIPRLWASRKLGFLTRQLRLESRSESLVREIRETAMRYGLLSEYTAYLVQEPNMVAAAPMPDPSPAPFVQTMDRRNAPRAMASAGAPAEVGAGAVQSAERQRERREVTNAADLARLEREQDEAAGAPNVRRVAGHGFRLESGVWVDMAHSDSMAVVEVHPYGEAYFALLRYAPELQQWFGEMESFLVAGSRVSIKIVDGGATTMTGVEVGRVVREFRGR